MRTDLLQCFSVILAISLCAGAAVANDDESKTEQNKVFEMRGYVPNSVASASTTETEPNDDCTMADPADVAIDDVEASINAAGDEDWYTFYGKGGDCVTIATNSLNQSTTDTQVYLYDAANCGDTSAYLVWDDDAGPGLFSLIDAYELPSDGTYYVRVKHWSSSGTGDYVLGVELDKCPTPPDNDTCDGKIKVECGDMVSGTTDLAANDIEDLDESCVAFGADGPDVFYFIDVPNAHALNAILVPDGWDPALWFVTDCEDQESCVAGVDAGFFNDPETLSWTNDTGGTVTIYVVVDGYFSGAHGPFDLILECEPVVPNEPTSFGDLKSNF